jgi:hypothetical protein
MKAVLWSVAAMALCNLAVAQVGTAVKDSAKAAGQKTEQIGDQAKAAVSSQPDKSVDKAKAQVHKAKASQKAKQAKQAAKDIGK